MGPPDVSIVIPTYNRAPVLAVTLELLRRQDYDGRFEVLVCDDGSHDATAAVIERLTPRAGYPLRYLHHGRAGARYSAARNLGIAAAEGRQFVVFLDDDMLVPPHFLRTHADYQRQPDTVSLGYRYFLEPGEPGVGLGLGFRIEPDWRERFFAMGPAMRGRAWTVAEACNFVVGRELLDLAGGFDEQFVGWGGEDVELAYRLHLLGGEFVLSRRAFGWHQHDPDPSNPVIRVQRGLRPDFSSLSANLDRLAAKYPDDAEVDRHVREYRGGIGMMERRAREQGLLA